MAIFFSLALSIQLCYNEVNERSDFMEIKETEVIRAAELLKQYCGEMDCTDCIFNYCGSCILHGSGYYGFYKPYNWSIDWIKGS